MSEDDDEGNTCVCSVSRISVLFLNPASLNTCIQNKQERDAG